MSRLEAARERAWDSWTAYQLHAARHGHARAVAECLPAYLAALDDWLAASAAEAEALRSDGVMPAT